MASFSSKAQRLFLAGSLGGLLLELLDRVLGRGVGFAPVGLDLRGVSLNPCKWLGHAQCSRCHWQDPPPTRPCPPSASSAASA